MTCFGSGRREAGLPEVDSACAGHGAYAFLKSLRINSAQLPLSARIPMTKPVYSLVVPIYNE
ncbi:MAG: hypothetical protein ABSG83_15155, partial [Roseiarcus sp.]